MRKLLALVAALVCLPGVVLIQDSGGGGATDYTTSVHICYAMGTDGTATEAKDDKCSTWGSDDASEAGTVGYGATAPAGSPVASAAVSFSAPGVIFAPDAVFDAESTSFSWGGWFLNDTDIGDTAMSKGTVDQIDAGLEAQPAGYRIRSSATLVDTVGGRNTAVWNHVVVTVSGTTTSVYVNGTLDCGGGACPTDGTGHANSADDWNIGANPGYGDFFVGDVYEVFYYDGVVLSAAQVCEITTTGLAGTATAASRDALTGGC